MAELTIILSVITIIALLFVQKLEFNFLYDKEPKIKISYSLFILLLTPSKNSKSKKTLKSRKTTLPSFYDSVKIIKLLISCADFKIDKLHIKSSVDEPHIFTIRAKSIISILEAVFALFYPNSANFTVNETSLTISNDPLKSHELIATISLRLYNILAVFLMFFFFKLKAVTRKMVKRRG